MKRGWKTVKYMASTMIVEAGVSEPYWEWAQDYAKLMNNKTVCLDPETGELKSSNDIYYGVPTDMQLLQPFGRKAYINIVKEVRRKNYKGRVELAVLVSFEENTIREANSAQGHQLDSKIGRRGDQRRHGGRLQVLGGDCSP